MRRTILEVYALAVCFVTVVCMVVTVGVGAYSLIQIVRPDFTMSAWSYDQYRSNDAFWSGCPGRRGCGAEDKRAPRPEEAVLTRQREDAFAMALASEQRDGGQTLVKAAIVALVDALAFLIHWLIARRARADAAG